MLRTRPPGTPGEREKPVARDLCGILQVTTCRRDPGEEPVRTTSPRASLPDGHGECRQHSARRGDGGAQCEGVKPCAAGSTAFMRRKAPVLCARLSHCWEARSRNREQNVRQFRRLSTPREIPAELVIELALAKAPAIRSRTPGRRRERERVAVEAVADDGGYPPVAVPIAGTPKALASANAIP